MHYTHLVDPGWLFHTGNPKILRWLKEKAITSLAVVFFGGFDPSKHKMASDFVGVDGVVQN